MKKNLTALLAVLLVSSAFAGCGLLGSTMSSQENSNKVSSSAEQTQSSTQSSVESSATQYLYTAFTATEKALFNEWQEELPFIANNEYYVEEYTYIYNQTMETGVYFYTVGNTQEEFDAYKELLDETYRFYQMQVEENGKVWYFYHATEYSVRIIYGETEKGYGVHVFAYTVADWDPAPPQSSEDSSVESSEESSVESSIESSEESSVESSVESSEDSSVESSTTDSSTNSSADDMVDGDVGEILLTLYGLTDGESVTGEFTLTGKIISLDDYNNPTIVVEGFEDMPVYCYRLQLPDASVGDIITVTAATMKNYQGTYEFMNCTLVENQGGGNGGTGFTADFTVEEKALFNSYFGEVIPFIANNEYYIEELHYDYEDCSLIGLNFYTVGNTQAEFNAYKAILDNKYESDGSEVDEYGNTWYYYSGNGFYFDISYYYYEDESLTGYLVDVYVYYYTDLGGGSDSSTNSSADDMVDGDVGEILLTLYGLKEGESVTGEFTLTGKIISLDGYNNPTIVVEGFENMPVYCYRLQLPDASVGDIITVTATTMKNYQGTYEFMNCTLVENQGGGNGGNQGGGASDGNYTYTDFTSDEKAMFNSYFGEVIPFLSNDEYYVDEYTYDYEDDGMTEIGLNFYTFGNTQAEFNAYKATIDGKYEFYESYQDDYGDTWYSYDASEYYIDISYYETDEGFVVDVYVYFYTEYAGSGNNGNEGGNTETDVDIITNAGKGLPTSANGVYDIDFTKATYVKNVTEQGYYIDGCPTLSTTEYNPSVLVIPVEFSDVTAASKGYTVSAIKAAFNGGEGETDYYSVHDYYYVSSYGQLDLNITVLDSWFRPQYASSYYASATIDYYGQEIFGGDHLIIDEALAYLSESMDLALFDADGNTCIDAVVLINTLDIDSESDFQWAYRYWNLYTDEDGHYYEYDGVSANDYMWASYQFLLEAYDEEENVYYDDSVRNTYTYIHEFGHVLGADDYYDTSYSETELENTPMGGCDVMDYMLGDHNAYTKFNYGWLTSSRLVVAEESVTLTLDAFAKNGDTIIIANNWDDDLGVYQEYYIVVYYTMTGLNGTVNGLEYGYFARDGIIVYHVNASLYGVEYGDVTYYDVHNNNTDVSDSSGTPDNLIEFIKSPEDNFTYIEGDSLSGALIDDQGNTIAYTFTVDSLTADSATLTFTKN